MGRYLGGMIEPVGWIKGWGFHFRVNGVHGRASAFAMRGQRVGYAASHLVAAFVAYEGAWVPVNAHKWLVVVK